MMHCFKLTPPRTHQTLETQNRRHVKKSAKSHWSPKKARFLQATKMAKRDDFSLTNPGPVFP